MWASRVPSLWYGKEMPGSFMASNNACISPFGTESINQPLLER